MYVPPSLRRRLWFAPLLLAVLSPGWHGRLVPVEHDAILSDARRHAPDDIVPASREGEREGEEWHAQYMGSSWARVFDALNLRGVLVHVAPPTYVAHVPPGMDHRPERADAYFRVETRWRWPWWWPGGGVDWRMPER